MISTNTNEFLWVTKYRPRTVAETILPTTLKKTFQTFVDQKNIPNLLLNGSAGVGKCLDGSEKIRVVVSEDVFLKLSSLAESKKLNILDIIDDQELNAKETQENSI